MGDKTSLDRSKLESPDSSTCLNAVSARATIVPQPGAYGLPLRAPNPLRMRLPRNRRRF